MSVAHQLYASLQEAYKNAVNSYLLLDGSRDSAIFQQIREAGYQNSCLYKGDLSEDYQAVSPHLISLLSVSIDSGNKIQSTSAGTLDESHLQIKMQLLEQVLVKGYGVVLLAPISFNELYKHLRHLLRVNYHQGGFVYFRFFSPFYLRCWLETANTKEQQLFFGPIDLLYGREQQNQYLYQTYLDQQARLQIETLSVHISKFSIHYNKILSRKNRQKMSNKKTLSFTEQQERFIEQAILKKQFEWISDFIHRNYKKQIENLSVQQVMGQTIRVIKRGRSYGLTDDLSLTWLVINSFSIAPYFDTQPSIQRCLKYHKDISYLFTCTTEQDWQQAVNLQQPFTEKN